MPYVVFTCENAWKAWTKESKFQKFHGWQCSGKLQCNSKKIGSKDACVLIVDKEHTCLLH
jgi:hypothetical protein